MKQLISFLEKDRKKNVSVLNHIDSGKEIEYRIENNFAVIRVVKGTNGKDTSIYFAGEGEISEKFIKSFIKKGDRMFCSVDYKFYEQMRNLPMTTWEEICYKFIYEKNRIDRVLNNNIENIREKDISIVDRTWSYTGSWSYKYLKSCIDSDVNSAIYIDNEIAGWSLSHSDGSIGTLFVLDKFRGRGIAQDVITSMTRKKLESSKLPYLFTAENNKKSQNLVSKVGYTKYKKVFWMGIKI
ncbi:MAG: hypothetical protein CR982_08005 [Candidatus Cloacimonadota bacterium]|nr:MAG: hypothetical protein CR982_08005 [Candidatus Cloacimonadota bacterium]PIE77622.1 MAG: hypothetical protein CSA15_11905 [Candidatus Delongbacteria bacterium]